MTEERLPYGSQMEEELNDNELDGAAGGGKGTPGQDRLMEQYKKESDVFWKSMKGGDFPDYGTWLKQKGIHFN